MDCRNAGNLDSSWAKQPMDHGNDTSASYQYHEEQTNQAASIRTTGIWSFFVRDWLQKKRANFLLFTVTLKNSNLLHDNLLEHNVKVGKAIWYASLANKQLGWKWQQLKFARTIRICLIPERMELKIEIETIVVFLQDRFRKWYSSKKNSCVVWVSGQICRSLEEPHWSQGVHCLDLPYPSKFCKSERIDWHTYSPIVTISPREDLSCDAPNSMLPTQINLLASNGFAKMF